MTPRPFVVGGLLTLALMGGGCKTSTAAGRAPAPEPTLRTSSAELKAPEPQNAGAPKTTGRLLSSGLIIENFAGLSVAKDLKQTPSEVIDTGVFRHVRYLSYQTDRFELNIYGDPQHPAGVEVGVYAGKALTKQEVRGMMARILQLANDREVIEGLSLEKGKSVRDGLTFEVTPATDDDSFGGWWISIYDERALDRARYSDADLKRFTTEEPPPKQPAAENLAPHHKGKKGAAKPQRVYLEDNSRKNPESIAADSGAP